MSGPVVSNSSPLIALDQIGQLSLLEALFQNILVPAAVVQEITPLLPLPTWITVQPLAKAIDPQAVSPVLGAGEQEALSLALESNATWIILDDRPARTLARKVGLNVIGTLGVLLAAPKTRDVVLRHQRLTVPPLILKPPQQFHLLLLTPACHQDQELLLNRLKTCAGAVVRHLEQVVHGGLQGGLLVGGLDRGDFQQAFAQLLLLLGQEARGPMVRRSLRASSSVRSRTSTSTSI
jgi:predicted nucleic acid-binding protein